MESKSADPWTYTMHKFEQSEEQKMYDRELGNQPPDGNLIKIHTAATFSSPDPVMQNLTKPKKPSMTNLRPP
jgi:hypothetical protein